MDHTILDLLSLMRFFLLGINDRLHVANSIWFFRDRLAKESYVEKLFRLLDRLLCRDCLIVHAGKMVDAFYLVVPFQRDPRVENIIIK